MRKNFTIFGIYRSVLSFHHPSHFLSFLSIYSTLQSHVAEKMWCPLTGSASVARGDHPSLLRGFAPSLTWRAVKQFPCLCLAGVCPHILALLRGVQGLNKEICGSNSNPGAHPALSCTRGGISYHPHGLEHLSNSKCQCEDWSSSMDFAELQTSVGSECSIPPTGNSLFSTALLFHSLAPNTWHGMEPWNALFMANSDLELWNSAYRKDHNRSHTDELLTAPSMRVNLRDFWISASQAWKEIDALLLMLTFAEHGLSWHQIYIFSD